jgi:hypothetical protein
MVSGVTISSSDKTPLGLFSKKSEQEANKIITKNPDIYSIFFIVLNLWL